MSVCLICLYIDIGGAMRRTYEEYDAEFKKLMMKLNTPGLNQLDKDYIRSEIDELDLEYKIDTFHISMCVEDNYV